MTATFAGSAPFPSTSRRFIVSPSAIIRRAFRTQKPIHLRERVVDGAALKVLEQRRHLRKNVLAEKDERDA